MGVSAGRVLLIPKGDWNAETTYTGLDWVRHNGATWVCKNTCTNIEPTEENSVNWQILARDGEAGTKITVDAEASDTSENPIQNKAIKKYVDEHTPEIADMTGATADQNGAHGLVPAPKIGDEKKALLGDGTWGSVDAIFTYKTKEEYDTAVANGEIPDGAKVIKEYDEGDGVAIIDVDTQMSDSSTNPVQNKVVTQYIDARKTSIGQNLIPYPYYRADSYTSNGITWTVNEDGSITANGTATTTAYYTLFLGDLGLEINRHYVLTVIADGGPISLFLANVSTSNKNTDIAASRRVSNATVEVIFHYSRITDFANDQLGLYVETGKTLTNCTVKIQLERGTVRHEYQPTTLSNSTLKKRIDEFKIPEITVDSAVSDTSENPIQNKAIKKYVDDHAPNITVDSAMSDSSTNPVQNKTAKAYMDAKKVPTFSIENIFSATVLPFCVDSAGIVATTQSWDIDNGGYEVCMKKCTAGSTVNLTVTLVIPANSIVIVDVNTLNQENIKVQGSNILQNFTDAPANKNLSISFTHMTTTETSSLIRYKPLIIHLA